MRKISKHQKGFTLLELLVVIAIIGILTSIVLVSIGSSRNKGSDSRIKSQLSSLRTQVSLYMTVNGNIGQSNTTSCGVGTMPLGSIWASASAEGLGVRKLITDSIALSGKTASFSRCTFTVTNNKWLVSVPLKTSGFWCVDYAGRSLQRTTLPAAGVVDC